MNNVYLIPHDDATYEACIAPVAPTESAVFLTTEGEYPVECYYRRLDMNGSSVYESYVCANRDELLAGLNYNGKAFHAIRALWDFDSVKAEYHDAWTIFNAGYYADMKIISEEWEAMRKESEGQHIGMPTVKELIAILTKLPQDYQVTCCGTDGYIHLFPGCNYITIDCEQYLT